MVNSHANIPVMEYRRRRTGCRAAPGRIAPARWRLSPSVALAVRSLPVTRNLVAGTKASRGLRGVRGPPRLWPGSPGQRASGPLILVITGSAWRCLAGSTGAGHAPAAVPASGGLLSRQLTTGLASSGNHRPGNLCRLCVVFECGLCAFERLPAAAVSELIDDQEAAPAFVAGLGRSLLALRPEGGCFGARVAAPRGVAAIDRAGLPVWSRRLASVGGRGLPAGERRTFTT